jgi:shikimate dehydrogenase
LTKRGHNVLAVARFNEAAMPSPDRFLLAAVMGWPIAQTRSPMLHNYWFEKHKLAGAYVPLAIPPERLKSALRSLPTLNFSGCNLTIPLKQDAMRIVDEVDVTAKTIGAISCVVVRPDGTLAGFNNDWYGFVHNILEFVPDWRADTGPIAVMGAGGGARAVVYGLLQRGAREIRLCNRTHSRAQTLAKEFGGPITVLPWDQRHDAIEGVAMLVNATSQGMVGQAPLDLRLDKLSREALVNDIIYIPRETPLIAAARNRGNRTVTGLGMLLHQGIPAWKAWFGIEPKVTAELRARIEATL